MHFISKILIFCISVQIIFPVFLSTVHANSDQWDTKEVEIVIQSGLEIYENWWNEEEWEIENWEEENSEIKYLCKKEVCKVNLTVEPYFEDLDIKEHYCEWDFWEGTFTTKDTDKKCNPGFVTYTPWEHILTVKIYGESDDNLITENSLSFENNFYSEEFPRVLDQEADDSEVDNNNTIDNIPEIIPTSSNESHNQLLADIAAELELDLEPILSGIKQEWRYVEQIDHEEGEQEDTNQENDIEIIETDYQETEENNSENIQILELEDVLIDISAPEIIFEIQSWLEETWSWDIYSCKTQSCKVNLSVEDIFIDGYNEKDYLCNWNFWSGAFTTTDTDKKCNPWFVSFWTGTHEIFLEVIYEDNPKIFSTWSLIIIHDFSAESNISSEENDINIIESEERDIEEELVENITTWWEANIASEHTVEDIKAAYTGLTVNELLQQPSCIENYWDYYFCDRSREECRVNLDFDIYLSDKEISWIDCKIQFSFQDDILETCNPNTQTFPLWENTLTVEVFDRESWIQVWWKSIIIRNAWYKEQEIQRSSIENNNNSSTSEEVVKINIWEIYIEVQSWLDENYKCKKKDCKVNLIYDEQAWEKCAWKFPGWEFTESTALKCNPWYIDYSQYWEYEIELLVYDKNYPENNKKTLFYFWNYEASIDTEGNYDNEESIDITNNETLEEDSELISEIEDVFSTDFKIALQGRKTDYKTSSGSTITCTVSPCNINLNGSDSKRSNWEKVELSWNNNGTIFIWNNPKAIWYESGEHIVEIYDWENSYTLTLIIKESELNMKDNNETIQQWEETILWEEFQVDKNIGKSLRILEVLPNPDWVDTNEHIKLINTWNTDINLIWVSIDDTLDAWSKKYLIDYDYILSPNETIIFHKYQTKINLNNSDDSVSLIYSGSVIDTIKYNFSVPDDYVLTHSNTDLRKHSVYVNRIIDGDTLEIILSNGTKETLRLVWVDTPEIYNVGNGSLEKTYWLQAQSFLASYILWKNVFLEYEDWTSRDNYWRMLWYIFYDDENINLSIIENWLSRAYNVYPFKYSKEFSKVEAVAKKEKLWIWWSTVYKKIVLAKIREDKKVIENISKAEAYHQKKEFYQDLNKDNIPDIFQNWENNSSVEWVASNLQAYNLYLQNSFYLKASKLQSWVKLSWKSIPSSLIYLTIWKENFYIQADNTWEFSILLWNHFKLWEHQVNIEIHDILWNKFIIEKEYGFEIDTAYIQKLKEVAIKKAQEVALAAQKAALKAAKKATEQAKKTSSWWKIYSSIFVKKAKAYWENSNSEAFKNSNILTNILIILSLIMIFLILRRKKLV